MTSPEELRQQAIQRVVATASDMIAGKLGIIEGGLTLTGLWHKVRNDGNPDADFDVFRVISSDTDALPIGSERQYWAADSLAQKDIEIKDVEDFYRKAALAACERLIQRFGGSAQQSDGANAAHGAPRSSS